MPLIEIATVRLHPSVSSSPPESFTSTWTHACGLATKAANGVLFQLYHSVLTAEKDVYYLVGGWQKGEDHIGFLSTPDAVTLAKSIGQYMTADVVRHIDGDIGTLKEDDDSGRPKKLRVSLYKVPEAKVDEWASLWADNRRAANGVGGWDLSAAIQKQHKAFRQMGEATNSVSAFGGKDDGGSRTWVWVEDGEKSAIVANLANVEPEVFEMVYALG